MIKLLPLLLCTCLMAQHHEPYAGPHGGAHAPKPLPKPLPKPWTPKHIPMAKRGPLVALPHDYREYRHHTGSYFFHKGLWYRHLGASYVLCYPPVGLWVDLPIYQRVIVIAGITYFVYNEVYYTRSGNGYEVVEPQILDCQ